LGLGFGQDYTSTGTSKRILFISSSGAVPAHWALFEQRKKLLLATSQATDYWIHFENDPKKLDPELMSRAYAKPDAVWTGGFNSESLKAIDFDSYTDIHLAIDKNSLKTFSKQVQTKATILCRVDERMACGVGLCFSCSVFTKDGPKRSCVQGPWYSIRDIELDL